MLRNIKRSSGLTGRSASACSSISSSMLSRKEVSSARRPPRLRNQPNRALESEFEELAPLPRGDLLDGSLMFLIERAPLLPPHRAIGILDRERRQYPCFQTFHDHGLGIGVVIITK